MLTLRKQILHDEAVERIRRLQFPGAWIGTRFHTAGASSNYSTEVAIRFLCEKGVGGDHPLLTKALGALRGSDETFAREFFRVGRILDSKGFGGSYLIRATLFARAGMQTESFVEEQVMKTLRVFEAALGVNSLSDVADTYRGKFVFKPNALWPCIYHMRLLAFTSRWRTWSNIRRIASSIHHILELAPFPPIYVRAESQLVSPCGILTNNLAKMHDPTPRNSRWFEEMELMSRIGVMRKVPELRSKLEWLTKMLRASDGKFIGPISSDDFTKWSAYTGLALEKDWRSEKCRLCDLTFRSLLVLHYSGFDCLRDVRNHSAMHHLIHTRQRLNRDNT
jgi:hypothetical protein